MRQTTKIVTLKGAKPAQEINTAIQALPVASEKKISYLGGDEILSHKAILVNNRLVDIPTKYYQIVQHGEAFRPIIEGLTLAGVKDWQFQLLSDDKRAFLRVFTTELNDGKSQILLGFQVTNSFDRSTTVNYGADMGKGGSWIEIVGYRQVCSNGLTMRVPLDQAEFVKPELRQTVKSLIREGFSFQHREGVGEKLLGMQYVVEAMSLLKKPLQAMIRKAQHTQVDSDKIREVIRKHFSERMTKHVMGRYHADLDSEGSGLWALYNAITYEVSHDVSVSMHEKGLRKASRVLEEALKASPTIKGGD